MTKKIPITEFDIFYISYDEPQKEEHWAKLLELAPWAQRVDGVKGFDSAHKRCAELSTTDRFITVDGDNIVYPEFFDLEITIPEKFKDAVLSWGARNSINGLVYGNGGVKLWTKDFVLNMRTHENAVRDQEKVDFCWDDKYIQLNNTYSDTCPNGSPFQAFRAGFREGVKMTLDRGARIEDAVLKSIHEKNLKRLIIWASIGEDVPNGLWAIYGTRLGLYKCNIEKDFDISLISDYDWFKNYFYTEIAAKFEPFEDYTFEFMPDKTTCPKTGLIWDNDHLRDACSKLLKPLKQSLGLNIENIGPRESSFFKSIYEAPKRNHNPIITEIEIDSK